MGIFIEFTKGEKKWFDPVPVLTKEYYKNILDKFDINNCEIDLIDVESNEKVDIGDDLLSQEYKLEMSKKELAKKKLREREIYGKKDWPKYLDSELIKLLVESGESVNIRNKHYNNFLEQAIYKKDIDLVNFLFSQEEKVIINMYNIYTIAKDGSFELMKIILEYEDFVKDINNVSWTGRNVLYYSIKSGKIEITRVLLDYGADINLTDDFEETPLFIAISNKKIEIAKELISKGADVNLGKSILIEYINKYNTPDIEFIKLLMENGLDITRKYKSHNIFHLAMTKCNTQVAELLCESLSKEYICNPTSKIKKENLEILMRYM